MNLRLRSGTPRVIAHLGPTNSGKTHAALAALVAAGRGAYASPLRMLAQEVHTRLALELGPDNAGLVTGEERINEHAPVISCTVELAPMSTDVLVIDEVHWTADPERGEAWTRLLLGAECRELHLVGSEDALPLIERAFPGFEKRIYTRFGPLEFTGPVRLAEVAAQTVVVVFSRKAVLALTRELSLAKVGRRVGALYGAMPLAERRRQIARFMSGETDVLVATDVLGHGVNLPCRTILFAETDKFDGVGRRTLEPWEVAQVAGRAGRFGHHDAGEVGTLVGLSWLKPSEVVVRSGIRLPGAPAFRRIASAVFGPSPEDFDGLPVTEWSRALGSWTREAQAIVPDAVPWLRIADVSPIRSRLLAIDARLLAQLSPDEAWAFARAPIDADRQDNLIGMLARSVATNARIRMGERMRQIRVAALEEAEQLAGEATVLRWFARRFKGAGGLTAAAADALEAAAATRVGQLIDRQLVKNTFGTCGRCGRASAPWFQLCDSCFGR